MFCSKLRLSRRTALAAIAILALIPLSQPAAAGERQGRTDPIMVSPLVWSALAPIVPVDGTDGKVHLVYELHVSNASHFTAKLISTEVLDGREAPIDGANQVFSSDGVDVTGKVRPFSLAKATQDAIDYAAELGPGQGGVMYFDVTFDRARDVPRVLKHRFIVRVEAPGANPLMFTAIDEGTEISRERALVIDSPLKGERWVVANGSGPILPAHRYFTQATNGALRPPEHFAIDFIQLDAHGRAYVGDFANVKSWIFYGTDIYSVARGRVIEVLDNMPDQIPGANVPPPSADLYVGNHVIVDLGNGLYALYAHMAPGSVRVRKGEHVRAGQVLGKLGNSGNSDGPHLHFQIMDSASSLNTHGMPFAFDRLTYQGKLVGSLDDAIGGIFEGKLPTIDRRNAGKRNDEMPLTLDVIDLK